MFKDSFKYYKSRNPKPSFEEVLDFTNSSSWTNKVNYYLFISTLLLTRIITILQVKSVSINSDNFTKTFDLIDPSAWEAFEILDRPGFIYIKNPFTSIGQRYWIRQAIEEYTKKPNKLNIDIHSLVPLEQNWWDYAKQDKSVLKKLRWSTLGYHHNWDTKIYSDQAKDTFPDNLSRLCNTFAQALGYDFKAEAAIVNFYHLDSTLAGHTDHSEEYLDAPLFSFSFGNSAVFLLGGLTIDEKPTAVVIHSGDVVIMSKESRLSYHAVPRIVKTEKQMWNDFNCESDVPLDSELSMYTSQSNFNEFQDYLEGLRINLNVRQVLPHGQLNLIGTVPNKDI